MPPMASIRPRQERKKKRGHKKTNAICFSYVLLVLAVSQVNHGLLPGNSTAVVLPSSYEKAHSDEHAC